MCRMPSGIEVAIVEDLREIREGLGALINSTRDSGASDVTDRWKRRWPGS